MNNIQLSHRMRNLKKMTPSEKKIAEFLETNYHSAAFETISSLSEIAMVGKATVGRFITKLGYRSFSEFKKDLRKEMVSHLELPIDRLFSKRTRIGALKNNYLDQHINYTLKNIEETRGKIDPADVNKAAEIMALCPGSLYVMGGASSQALAQFFSLFARYLRDDVHLLDADISKLPHSLIGVCADDVLLAIAHSRFSSPTVKAVRWFSAQGGRVIHLTDRESTPVSPLVDIQLVASSAGPPLFNSRVVGLLVLESLLMAMISHVETDIYKRFEKFEALCGELGTFDPSTSSSQRRLRCSKNSKSSKKSQRNG